MFNLARVVFAGLLAVAAGGGTAVAQQAPGLPEPPPLPGPLGENSTLSGTKDLGPGGLASTEMLKQMARQRNVIRQKDIVEETDRLLDLAKQLKTAVDKTNKDELSLEVVDTAAEIEKLAKQVKEKMRDGQ